MSEETPEVAQPSTGDIRVLIVDNEPAHAHAMSESLEREGYPCVVATSGPEGARCIAEDTFDLVVTDLMMNEVDGMEVLGRAKEVLPDSEIIMVTGHATIPKAVEAMQLGAFNFLEKPITPTRLRVAVGKAADAVRLKRQNQELHQRLDERFGFDGIVFSSQEMSAVLDRLKRIAATDATVLITGENGTGKELIAQALHQNSLRKGKRFHALNCAGLPENLVETSLFGHVKGAYTDALNDRVGAFEYANGGTLFLDEVGDMPLTVQTKLLRVLEERRITRVGDNKSFPVNIRLISATNRDLESAIESQAFRSDLYYRLKVVTVHLPSLRERRDDIVPLLDHFRKHFAREHSKKIRNITPAATRKCFGFDWPGNVRQLRNAVETMVVLDVDGVLDVDDLPPELADVQPTPELVASGPVELIGRPLREIERWAIEETLKMTNNNREQAAKVLGMGARTIYRKLEQYTQDGEDGVDGTDADVAAELYADDVDADDVDADDVDADDVDADDVDADVGDEKGER
jgi:two-component system, NtrC family, response regulator HydG